MKQKRTSVFTCMLAAAALQLATSGAQAQIDVLISGFDNADSTSAWGNWFGTAFYTAVWDSSDASNNPNSGSILMTAFYPDSGIGGCCGSQFVLYNGNSGISPSLWGNGGPIGTQMATNVSFDVRFDPTSLTSGTNWPTIEVGTRGIDYGQHDFGTFTIPANQTNWVHESITIAANTSWTNIPNVYFKYYSTSLTGFLKMYIDNIHFTLQGTNAPITPPTMSIAQASQGLRVFAGSVNNTYDREHLTAVDTNQSWVGGRYPVSYSFTLTSFPKPPTNQTAIFRYHLFMVPLNYAAGNNIRNNEYLEYQANDDLWLNITASSNVVAQLAWKVSDPNDNPTNITLSITNPTAVGKWTLTFNSATAGTVTAPGAAPVAFTLPADVAAQFANPLLVQFGVQPDSGWGEGQWVDVTDIQTIGVASPGLPIHTDFTTTSIVDTNVWDVSNSAQASSLVITSNTAWWVSWTYPDYGSTLTAKAALNSSIPWKTPLFYASSNTAIVSQARMGGSVWSLLPPQALPTADGNSNGVPASTAFFRLQAATPAQ